MKTLFVLVTILFASQASAKSCIPSPDNPGGCMGIPDLNHGEDKQEGTSAAEPLPGASETKAVEEDRGNSY